MAFRPLAIYADFRHIELPLSPAAAERQLMPAAIDASFRRQPGQPIDYAVFRYADDIAGH